MNDLTILHYTCHRISATFAHNVRRELVRSLPAGVPIVVVSQNGTDERHRAMYEDFQSVRHTVLALSEPPSIAQVYRNLLIGCRYAETNFCAAAEDDTLYTPDHWFYRPELDTFAYNEHRVVLTRRLSADGRSREAFYFANPRTQMALGVFPRELMIETLEERFAKHPNPPIDTTVAKKAGHGEPGRYEKNLGLTPRKLERFKWTTHPCVTVNHSDSLMGRRAYRPDMPQWDNIEPWGNATALWERIVG